MGNLKTLRGLLVCIAFLENTSTNSVNAQCQDIQKCVDYSFPLVCKGTWKEWYLINCPKSCKVCTADQLSKTYMDTSTTTFISSKSTIREERNISDVNKGGAATCLDKADCSKYRMPLDCNLGRWFIQNCQASCNVCPKVTSETTRTSTQKVSSPTCRTTTSKRVASVTAPSHPQRTVVTTWIPSPAAPSHPQRTVVTTWIPYPAVSSGTCKDDKVCTRYKDLHRLCSGTDGWWYQKNCRLSCNMCITDQVSMTRDISHTSTTSPLKARNVSFQVDDDVSQATSPVKASNANVQVHDDVSQATSTVRSRTVSVQVHDDASLATSPAKSRNVSEQVRDDASQDFPESASQLPSPHQNVIIAVVIIAVIILIVFIAGVVIFRKHRDKSSGKNPLQPTHDDMWSSDGQVVFTNVYEQTVLFSPHQRDQSSDQNHAIDINPPKQVTEETEVRDTCRVSVNKDGLVYSILDFKDFQPKDFVPPSPTQRIEYATIDFGGAISCTKNTRD